LNLVPIAFFVLMDVAAISIAAATWYLMRD
jgi:hypothetical protein